MTEDQIISELPVFNSWIEHQNWCWKVRIREIKTTQELLNYAKQMTHAEAYGGPINVR